MYKRENCAVWTIEERDFRSIESFDGNFIIKDLWACAEVELLKQIDIILEYQGKRYLGYLDINNYEFSNDYAHVIECTYIVCQENYLDGIKIVREIEYNANVGYDE